MYEFLIKIYESLGAWPQVQFAVLVVGAYVGIKFILRGERDKDVRAPSPVLSENGSPKWTMYGPVHDAMSAVHEMNEQSRKQIDLLERIDETLLACKVVLELIRNESRLR